MRLKFESENTGNKRVNIDNVQMSDWEDPTLLKDIKDLKDLNDHKDLKDGIYDLSGRKIVNRKSAGPVIIEQGKKKIRK